MFDKISKLQNSLENAALCIITNTKGSTPRKIGSKMLVYANGTIAGTIGGGALEKQVIEDALNVLKSGEPKSFEHCLAVDLNMSCGGSVDVYIEPIIKKKKLYIFGGGHIGKVLAKFSKDLDFDVTVIDERENIFEGWKTENLNLINRHYSEVFNEIIFDENTFITVLSYTHENDKAITEFCAKQKFAYLGTIASKRKAKLFTDYFLENKVLIQEQIDKIDMPMGIKINSETPEEIAISILAKLIDVRGNKL